MVSDEKFAINISVDTMYIMSHFSLAVFQDFLLASAFNCLILMCLDVDFFECIPFKLTEFHGCVD